MNFLAVITNNALKNSFNFKCQTLAWALESIKILNSQICWSFVFFLIYFIFFTTTINSQTLRLTKKNYKIEFNSASPSDSIQSSEGERPLVKIIIICLTKIIDLVKTNWRHKNAYFSITIILLSNLMNAYLPKKKKTIPRV